MEQRSDPGGLQPDASAGLKALGWRSLPSLTTASAQLLNHGHLRLPFLGHSRLCTTTADPQAWAEGLRHTIPVRRCEPLQLSQPFRNRTAIAPLGAVTVVAVEGSAIAVTTDHHGAAQLVLPYRGSGTWRVEGKPFTNPVGESVLFLPPAPLALENDVTSGVAINIAPAQLLQTAMAMAGPEGAGFGVSQALQEPKRLLLDDRVNQALINSVYRTLASADQTMATAEEVLPLLRLDDLLIRLTLLLLVPALRQSQSVSQPITTPSKRSVLDDLAAWMDANLGQPIGLTELEQRSGYARRTLQYSFKEAYGCTPLQWLKRRRLEAARHRLLQPLPGDTVARVAAAAGYTHLASFSRDFGARFGTRASDLLRRSSGS